jgi:hypothetical protein
MKEAAACKMSCSMEPQQSTRTSSKREDNGLMEGATVEEHDSDRKIDAKRSQN